METYKAAHPTPRIVFPLFHEGFNEPVTELQCSQDGKRKTFQEQHSQGHERC